MVLSVRGAPAQRALGNEQVREFHHDCFVDDQVRDFLELALPLAQGGTVVDVGGGCGFFAAALTENAGLRTRVLDTDPASIDACRACGVDARLDDALTPAIVGDESVACFNLILHHLVGDNETSTRALQAQALAAWHGSAAAVFVNEYIYESWIMPRFSPWLIWRVTASAWLSLIGRVVSRFAPSLRANTFGVGVRFRTAADWHELFDSCDFEVIDTKRGREEPVSLPRRMLLISSCRRDSFLLRKRVRGVIGA